MACWFETDEGGICNRFGCTRDAEKITSRVAIVASLGATLVRDAFGVCAPARSASRQTLGLVYLEADLRQCTGDRLTMSTDHGNLLKKNFDSSQWVSQAEAAKIRKVTRQAISRLVKKGRFTTLVIGGKAFLKRSDVEGFTPRTPGPAARQKNSRRTIQK